MEVQKGNLGCTQEGWEKEELVVISVLKEGLGPPLVGYAYSVSCINDGCTNSK